MKRLDTIYRALLDYRNQTREQKDCKRLQEAFSAAFGPEDCITVVRHSCTIDETWVREIEQGLVHIEKAIKQERQFIQSNGEVEPIEKVKRVGRESVEHLSRHSDLITRMPEDENIIPDKLYTVERLNDYTVYENRFLYMLLCYLRDFVTLRYEKIVEATNTYRGKATFGGSVVQNRRKIQYQIQYEEENRDDTYLQQQNAAQDILDRLDLILKTILAFLRTPLMEDQAKVAMLKPPITKTNVLRMNHDFRGAVALYDFIISYDKPGYEITEQKRERKLSGQLGEEAGEVGALLAYLTYVHGLDLKPQLQVNFEAEENRRRQAQILAEQKALEALSRKVQISDGQARQYVLNLEQQNRKLQYEYARMDGLKQDLLSAREAQAAMHQQLEQGRQERQILLEQNLQAEQVCQQRLQERDALHEKHVLSLDKQYKEQIQQTRQLHQQEMAEARQQLQQAQLQAEEARQEALHQQHQAQAMAEENARLQEECILLQAQLRAARLADGQQESGDFTQKEDFDALEREYQLYTAFYRKQWGKAKKHIRTSLISMERIKQPPVQKEKTQPAGQKPKKLRHGEKYGKKQKDEMDHSGDSD